MTVKSFRNAWESQALDDAANSLPKVASSVYEELFTELIQGNTLTVPKAYVNVKSMISQFNRWRNQFPVEFGYQSKTIHALDIPEDPTHLKLLMRDKKAKTRIPFTLEKPDGS